jgi:hypothetical protein
MIKVEDDIFIHNGHDNENEKIDDFWKFNLNSNKWTQIEQHGEIPPGRNGHTLSVFEDYII